MKFADVWVPVAPGTDAAFGLAAAHVALKEYYVDKQIKCLREYARRYTDLPFLVVLEPLGDGTYAYGRFLRASDVPELKDKVGQNPEWKTVVVQSDGSLAVPYGSIGFRWDGSGKWNLQLKGITARGEGDIDPVLSVMELGKYEKVKVKFFAVDFDAKEFVREVPAIKVGDRYVTTVFDLLAAHLGVRRGDLGGDYPASYDDPKPFTPAWQEAITGVSRQLAIQVARDFMILVFGMGLTQPWLLPVAVFLSLLQRERLFMYSLLVGPQAQLSVHYLTLATAIGYVARGKFKGGAVGS